MQSSTELVMERQEPLRQRYRVAPDEARITDRGEATGGMTLDPFHGVVIAGPRQEEGWRIGIHRAVGGDHDLPNPGDVLCAALAACLDTTLRILAARLRIPLESLTVVVTGEVDVRGTLAVSDGVSVGFQRLRCQVEIEPAKEVPAAAVDRLLRAAERACVVLQTLRNGVPVELSRAQGNAAPATISSGALAASPARDTREAVSEGGAA